MVFKFFLLFPMVLMVPFADTGRRLVGVALEAIDEIDDDKEPLCIQKREKRIIRSVVYDIIKSLDHI